jgi:hypothetical protein
MSADNWAQCPRCTSAGTAKLQAREAAIQASYGVVPVADFDDARRALEADKAAFERRAPTFREDYEIYGADTGVVKVGYSGSCGECGLQLDFTEEHPIPDWKTS